ncbi:alkaline phosphatase [Salipaludibacillus aurantiacus]|uniref:Alkaline phosphatase n=1 Tax=Salipaludibacillus aurantiacus TaxID=1601833 RepID=A0A1H9UDD3_9BACI|nr:alkaline phosphatase [Salipaludibacillus aurantiacus]SES07465.1 alkaline phosphatase [Salipaludibacillus aurantiacus]
MKKVLSSLLSVSLLVSMTGMNVSSAEAGAHSEDVENVIFLIPDGFSASYATNYRHYKGEETIFDELLVGLMQTTSADNEVTDSAAAGTAMATGVKTNNDMMGIDPDGNELQSILKASTQHGKSSGLVATSTISHATPGAFAASVPTRANQADIAAQFIGEVDVLLGGGKDYFLPEEEGGEANSHLLNEAIELGYEFIENRDELLNSENNDKLLGLFADDAMAPELDRGETDEPSLAEMTDAAIQSLSLNEDGFFLMVEGSQIDWAGHEHDSAWAMTDTEAFEKAVETAVDFAKEDGNTLVVIAGDHDTGGMSVGGYDEYNLNIDILHDVTATGSYMADQLNENRDNVAKVVQNYAGIDLTDEEITLIQESEEAHIAINQVISERAYIGYSSDAHTGVDVPLYAYGPHSEKFNGFLDNTEVPFLMAEAMGIDFDPYDASVSSQEEAEGGALPDTATSNPAFALAGLLVAFMSGGILIYLRKTRRLYEA